MKSLSLVLNAILLVAVAFLFYFHYSEPKGQRSVDYAGGDDLKIAYINADTVLKYYEYFKLNKDKFEAKGKQLDQELKNRALGLQSEIESYQRNVNSMTIGQARAVEEDLGKKRQNLQLYQESLSQQMLADQDKMTKELYTKVTTYLKKYGQKRGLQVVLKYDASSDLLFGGDSLDITTEVIKGLNETYNLEKASPTKTDSAGAKKK